MDSDDAQRKRTTSVLGFGDLRGFYDFDTMSMSLELSDIVSSSKSPIFNKTLVYHEMNHWHQQVTSSFGSLSTHFRASCLYHTSIIWDHLSDEFQQAVLEGSLCAPLSVALKTKTIDFDSLPFVSASQRSIMRDCVNQISGKLSAQDALATCDWIRLRSTWRAILSSIAIELSIADHNSNFVEKNDPESIYSSNEQEINAARLAYLCDDWVKELEARQTRKPQVKLWDTAWLLEASCVAQEFAFAAITHPNDYEEWAQHRFAQISTSNYAGPIRQVVDAAGLGWSIRSLLKCASLTTALIEVAINPPLPPRAAFHGVRHKLKNLHPSLRFETLIETLQRRDLNPKDAVFADFDKMNPDDRFFLFYLDLCISIGQKAGVSVAHMKKRSTWTKHHSFEESLNRVEEIDKDPTKAMEYFLSIYENYDGLPQNFISDCGHQSRFYGSIHFQNSIIAQAHVEGDRLLGATRRYESEKTVLNTQTLREIVSLPLNTYVDKKEGSSHRQNRVFELLATHLKYNLVSFNGLFNHQIRASATNLPGTNDVDFLDFLRSRKRT